MFLHNLSKFISNYRYEQASEESLNTVKAAFLDFFGVTYKGIEEVSSKIAFKTIVEVFSRNPNADLKATIIRSTYKSDILNAAFVNAMAAHVLELDDGHRGAQIHLGSIVFPTALSISEAYNLSGREFLEAVLVGYEVGILLGKIVNPAHRSRGFHTTGTVGTFVAGAVASKLLKLGEDEISNALGLCGTQAAGLLESDHTDSMGKSLHVGKAVYNGILSSILAKNGFVGSESIFEGDEGFLKTMVFGDEYSFDDFSFEDLLKDVGQVNVRDIYFKKYPFCRHIHSSIDTALKLKASIGDEFDHIESVTVKTYSVAAEHDFSNPKSTEELKQSLPYAVAIALVLGDVNLDTINQLVKYGLLDTYTSVDIINSIKKLVNNMTVVCDEKLDKLYPDKRPSNVIIKFDKKLRNGEFQNFTLIPKGDIENPFQLRELIDKFKQLNPNYDIDNLIVIDTLENYSMREVIGRLNR